MDGVAAKTAASGAAPAGFRLRRAVTLIGLMGCGKSAIGRRLASRLDVTFVDSDAAIEADSGLSISEIFAAHGEPAFRELERAAVERALADEKPLVLSTGGGAFLDRRTRGRIRRGGVVLWLRADLDLLVERCSRNDRRPLLAGRDVREILSSLMNERYPVYAEADLVLDAAERPHEETVRLALDLLVGQGAVEAGEDH